MVAQHKRIVPSRECFNLITSVLTDTSQLNDETVRSSKECDVNNDAIESKTKKEICR